MSTHPQTFHKRVDKAIADPVLKKALPFAQDRLRNGRDVAADQLGNIEEWRDMLSTIRLHTIENLDSYLEQFATT